MRQATDGRMTSSRRRHFRVPMDIAVRLIAEDVGEQLFVQNRDISWGGVQFVLPKGSLAQTEPVRLIFPWSKGGKFVVDAEVLRINPLENGHTFVAARFSSISMNDQQRLEKLLRMLEAVHKMPQGEELVPSLEVLFNDPQDMASKVAEVATGRLSVTVFSPYEVNQSICLVLVGITELPVLRLRARVNEVRIFVSEALAGRQAYELDLSFEHPLGELKRVAESFIEQLCKIDPTLKSDWSFSVDHSLEFE